MTVFRSVAAAAALAFVGADPAQSQQVQIAGLSDIAFGTWRGSGDLVAEMHHCVRRTGQGSRFNLQARSSTGGRLVLGSGGNTIPYRLSYNDGAGWRDFPSGSPVLNGLQGAVSQRDFQDCLNGNGMRKRLRVRLLESALSAARAGRYSGTLILNVSPE